MAVNFFIGIAKAAASEKPPCPASEPCRRLRGNVTGCGAAVEEAPKAYMLQFGFGDAKVDRFKAWQVKAAYRRLEELAIPLGMGQTSAYFDNSTPVLPRAGKGWEYNAAFGLTKALTFGMTFYDMTNLDGGNPQRVGQFDVVYKF